MCRTDAITPDLADVLITAHRLARPVRRIFPGTSDQARHARRFVARVLDGCPVADTAILLTSVLVTNALTHTRTSLHGTFEVIIWASQTATYIAVIDDGSATVPAPSFHPQPELAESGRGLELVDLLASQWGHHGHTSVCPDPDATSRTLVWFRLDWPAE